DSKIVLTLGEASQLPYENETFDFVLSVEAAFHFSDRARFFKECLRVLRPGGRLAIADLCGASTKPGVLGALQKKAGKVFWRIPDDNLCTPAAYAHSVEQQGFRGVTIRSIWEDVYPPFVRFARKRLGEKDLAKRMSPLFRML